MLKKHLATLVLATAGIMTAGTALGSPELLHFTPVVDSSSAPQFSWTGPSGNYLAGSGSQLNLNVSAALVIPGPIAGETTDPLTGSTFTDASLALSSATDTTTYKDNGAEVSLLLGDAYQSLSDGTFTISASDGTLLLQGDITNNSMTVPLTGSNPSFEGGTVTYTGGAIYTAMVAAGFGTTGDVSISMNTTDGNPPTVNYDPAAASGPLLEAPATVGAFNANATGIFDVAPEPASLGLTAVMAIFACRRRRV